jgi:hypothetical protein
MKSIEPEQLTELTIENTLKPCNSSVTESVKDTK